MSKLRKHMSDNNYKDFIPYEKKSPKEKRKENNKKRKDWGNIDPRTKIVPDRKKEYKRKKFKRDDYYEDFDD